MLVFYHCDKYLRETNEKEEIFVLAQGVRSFSPWLAGSTASCRKADLPWQRGMVEESGSQHGQETEKKQKKTQLKVYLPKN
jgi:hypothetical protein